MRLEESEVIAKAKAAGAVELESAEGVTDPATEPGLVVICADEAGRYSRFAMSAQGILVTPGTRTAWMLGSDIAESRNTACQAVLDDPNIGWVWFIDDDHAFSQEILIRLLAHRLDIVGPVCLRRVSPFLPTATGLDGDFLRLGDYAEDEVAEVMQTGSSGLLIRREVVETIDAPWFELGFDADGDRISEDITFCQRAAEYGYKIHVDMGLRLGHITTCVIWPSAEEGVWQISYEIANGARLHTGVFAPDGSAA